MRESRLGWWLVGVAAVAVAVAIYWALPGEESRIRARLEALAEALGAPAGEQELARIARVAGLRGWFTDDATVEVAAEVTMSLHGKDEIAGMAARVPVASGGMRVELPSLEITVGGDRTAADARVETRVVARDSQGEPETIDARMIALSLRKIDGTWLISHARVLPADDAMK